MSAISASLKPLSHSIHADAVALVAAYDARPSINVELGMLAASTLNNDTKTVLFEAQKGASTLLGRKIAHVMKRRLGLERRELYQTARDEVIAKIQAEICEARPGFILNAASISDSDLDALWQDAILVRFFTWLDKKQGGQFPEIRNLIEDLSNCSIEESAEAIRGWLNDPEMPYVLMEIPRLGIEIPDLRYPMTTAAPEPNIWLAREDFIQPPHIYYDPERLVDCLEILSLKFPKELIPLVIQAKESGSPLKMEWSRIVYDLAVEMALKYRDFEAFEQFASRQDLFENDQNGFNQIAHDAAVSACMQTDSEMFCELAKPRMNYLKQMVEGIGAAIQEYKDLIALPEDLLREQNPRPYMKLPTLEQVVQFERGVQEFWLKHKP